MICANERLPLLDEVAVGADEAPDILSVHGERERVGERAAGGRVGATQDRERGAGELLPGAVVVHYLDAAIKSEFEGEAPHDAHEEAVEGPYLREVLRRNDLSEKRRAGRVTLRALCEKRDEPLEDLARRRTREGKRDDFVRFKPALYERNQPLGKRLRLASPGRRRDKDVRLHAGVRLFWYALHG